MIVVLLATLAGSTLALIGGALLVSRESFVRRHSLALVSFAAGSMIGAAFLEVLPEAIELSSYDAIAPALLAGVLGMFLFERVFHWYHCHVPEEHHVHPSVDSHSLPAVVLAGDVVHNFLDGVIIALAFAADVGVGLATTFAVFMHELPQELGDFSVMLHAGWKKSKVLFTNFLVQLVSPLGAVLAYLFLRGSDAASYLGPLLGFSAGAFIYIAVSDLLPEIRHRSERVEVAHMVALFLGLGIIWALGTYLPE